MRLYKKYCCKSKNYNECVKMTEACASENNCNYLIENNLFDNIFDIEDLDEIIYYGFLLEGE